MKYIIVKYTYKYLESNPSFYEIIDSTNEERLAIRICNHLNKLGHSGVRYTIYAEYEA